MFLAPVQNRGMTEDTATLPSTGLDATLAIEWAEVDGDRAVARWTVGKQHLQPLGIVHGGVYCAVNESAASLAGQVWLGRKGLVVGVNNNTDFLRQAGEGARLTTVATPIHRGRQSQLWLMETTNEEGKVLARGQVRLAHIEGEIGAEFAERFGL